MLVDPDTGAGWDGWGVSEMEGVVPRRRDCPGESSVLEGSRSMSPKGGRRGRRKVEALERTRLWSPRF